jgi:hypothetical protein
MDTVITGTSDGAPAVTLADVADLIHHWSTQHPMGNLDDYLTDQLRGKRVATGTRTFTVTGVMNAGFNGQGLHGHTDDGKAAVHYIR